VGVVTACILGRSSSRFDPAGILAATSNKAVRVQSGAISNAGCA